MMKSVRAGLAASVLNEVLNGLSVQSFEEEFGLEKPNLEALRKRAASTSEANGRAAIALTQEQAIAVGKVLTRVLDELGPADFETHTGCQFELAQAEAAQLRRK